MVGTGRLGPKPRPHPDLGLSIFQDSDYGPAAEDVPNSGDSAGGAAPYGRSADASVQPLRFASLGFNPYPPHYPTSKASSFFFFFFLSFYNISVFISPTRKHLRNRWWERRVWRAATNWRLRGWLGGCPLRSTPSEARRGCPRLTAGRWTWSGALVGARWAFNPE